MIAATNVQEPRTGRGQNKIHRFNSVTIGK
jgi:hypothetical protein